MNTSWRNWSTRAGRAVAAVIVSLLAASCTVGSGNDAERVAPADQPKEGGTLVLGALQEPACADWYAACGISSVWGRDMLSSQTLPRAFDFVDNVYRPSILLAGEPTVSPGPPQVVTYRLNPSAVWSDGTRITSADFKYTAEQAKLAGSSTAAAAVDTVDASDPGVAKVTFKDPTPAWRDNFARLLPNHLLAGKDRGAVLRDGYTFSGGPWALDHWTRGVEIKLVPNARYWGPKPHLDSVVFKVITDSSAYLAAYKTGQLDMAYFAGPQRDILDLKGLTGTHFESSIGFSFEVVMFNTAKPPLDSKAVRQALAFGADRDAIVLQQSGSIDPAIKPAQALMSPGNREWYTQPYRRYERDLGRVKQLMTDDGWAKGTDGVWAKAGTRATVELNTGTGNARREQAEEILRSQWKEAGFDVSIVNANPATLLTGKWFTDGTFQAAIVSLAPPATDPNLCGNFCSKNIPTETKPGNNVSRIASKPLDDLWEAVAKELDDTKRHELVNQAQQTLADEMPALPLNPVLDIIVFNEAKVGGVKTNPAGAFYNLSEWYCRSHC